MRRTSASYDHSHKQRLKDMKAMVRDPNAGARARKAEAKADGLVSMKLAGGDQQTGQQATGGFKKGGFKKSGFKSAFTPVEGATAAVKATPEPAKSEIGRALEASREKAAFVKKEELESDTEDEGYELYDPKYPTN
jgi:hypothetical protein